MRGCLWFFLGCLLVTTTVRPAGAHDDHPPRKVANAEAYRPTPLPDRIILTWTGDPTTTQAVTWRTDTTIKTAFAEFAVATDGPEFVKQTERVTAQTSPLKSDLSEAHYHTVEFQGLTPATKYVYRVGDGVNWSEWIQFTTASTAPLPFSFVYFGDAQNDVRSHWSRVVREAFRDAPQTRFFLHAGDLINNANSDAEWGEWFQAGGWANGMIPSVPVTGNHEYTGRLLGKVNVSNHWRPQFALPGNGPETLTETVYSIDFQGVRIIVLNSNERQDAQTAWLKTVLANNPQRWTIVSFHHPLFSAAKNRDNPLLREAWKPLFDEYHVDLVLQGHDHAYARSGLVGTQNTDTGTSGQDDSGTVYVVSVSGPKMYPLGADKNAEFVRVAEDTQLFQVISIDGQTLRYQAKTAAGRLYDAFTLTKPTTGPNVLTEEVPEVPARIRGAE
ncbi:metallophosphoesterase [bacterium]|nr:metallophosphoesterase [bacterium]